MNQNPDQPPWTVRAFIKRSAERSQIKIYKSNLNENLALKSFSVTCRIDDRESDYDNIDSISLIEPKFGSSFSKIGRVWLPNSVSASVC